MAFTRTVRFAYANLLTASSVVITASAAATGYPASNCGNAARWAYWRSTTTTGDQWIQFDTGAAQTIACFLLAHWKAHSGGGTITAQTSPDGSTWTSQGVFTLPSPDPTGVIALFIASGSFRYVRIYFTNVGAVSDYVEAGAVFAGPYYQPTRTLDKGYTVQLLDRSVERFAIGGQRSVVKRPVYWTVTNAVLPMETDADRVSVTALITAVGYNQPFFFAIDPTNPGYWIWYGHFDVTTTNGIPGIKHVAPQLWDFPFTFVEDVD